MNMVKAMSSKTRTALRQQEINNNKANTRHIAREVHQETAVYQGPLPPAEELIKYEQACHNAADRIISMAERQALHRQEAEKQVIKAQNRNSIAGIVAGFLLSIGIVVAGTICILNGYPVAGATIVGIDLVALSGIYVYGTQIKNK